MKNVFGVQHSKDKKTSINDFDGAEFICKQIKAERLDSINNIDEAEEVQKKKMSLPLPLSILKGLSFFAGMVIILGILRADVTISEAFANAPGIFYALPIVWIIFGILQVMEIVKKKKHMASDEFEEFIQNSEETAARSMQELGIPITAPLVDVFSYAYKLKKDKTVPVSGNNQYVTVEFFLYQDESKLYLADHTSVFGFNKKDFVKIEKIAKRTTSLGWNKPDAFNSDKYKKYKITQNQYGTVFYKYHYSLQLSSSGKIFEILVPPYEIATISRILNLPYEE